MQMLKSSGLLQPDGQQGELKLEAESYKSHSRFMKTKVDPADQWQATGLPGWLAGWLVACMPASTSACEGALHAVACCMLHVACCMLRVTRLHWTPEPQRRTQFVLRGGTNALLFFYSVLQCLFCEAPCVRTLPTLVQSRDRLILTGHRRSKVKRSDGVKANQRAAEGSLSWGNVTRKKKATQLSDWSVIVVDR